MDQWGKTAGAMVVRHGGRYAHSLRVIVLAEDKKGEEKTFVEVQLKPSLLVRKLLLYLVCEYIKAYEQAAEVAICTVPGMLLFVFVCFKLVSSVSTLTPFFAAIQKFTSYMKIRKILTKLNIFVPYMLAEPVAAFVQWYFTAWKNQTPSIFPAELPECLRVYFTMDLGAGMLCMQCLIVSKLMLVCRNCRFRGIGADVKKQAY